MTRPTLDRQNPSERLNMMISKGKLEAIDDWRYLNRVPSLSEAVRRLIAAGLASSRQEGGTP